jgi:hypothetical protein
MPVSSEMSNDVEVVAKATRRRLTAEDTLTILREADAGNMPGACPDRPRSPGNGEGWINKPRTML